MKAIIIGVLLITATVFIVLYFNTCGTETPQETTGEILPGGTEQDVAYQPEKDEDIQRYNLEMRKRLATVRTPCDTLNLAETIINYYPKGTYLIDFDKRSTFSVPQYAVIYQNRPGGGKNIFSWVTTSRLGFIDRDRLVEPKNLIGYDASFIDLDSTALGTAFMYLFLFECDGEGNFTEIWRAPAPSHGGFNKITMENWRAKNIPFIRANFHYGQGVGHINYNYFLIDGTDKQPHLLMTYEGINFKRSITDANGDRYPDYIEYVYIDDGQRVQQIDSVTFIWQDSLYVNTRNPRQTRLF